MFKHQNIHLYQESADSYADDYIDRRCHEGVCIVHIVQHLRPGGIECLVLAMMKNAGAKDRTLIVALEGRRQDAMQAWPVLSSYGSSIYFLDKPEGLSLVTVFKLHRLLKRLQADVIHTHHIGPLVYAGCINRLLSKRRHIHTEHDAWHLQSAKRRALQRSLLACSKPLLVADARSVASPLQELVKKQTVYVVYNGIDSDRFVPGQRYLASQRLGFTTLLYIERDIEQQIFIGTAGRLQAVKGQAYLIHAMLDLPNNSHLLIAGSGPDLKTLQQLALALGLKHRVHFLGQIEDMPSFYQMLHVFSLPSLNEGFPLSPLEAQSCNVPVVCSDVGACREAICPQTGLLVPKGDVDALGLAINTILTRGKASAAQTSRPSPRQFVKKGKTLVEMMNCYQKLSHSGALSGHFFQENSHA
ncbi:MAG: glycosyltransferase [Pseudomonadales bacterium]|nr:glycosyltransferase [Pseudomonadales bacterium]